MIMALIGFLAPFLPDLFGFGKQWMDHKQEMDMIRLRHEQAKDESTWRIEEAHVQADIAMETAVRKPHESYGVKLLDKGANNPYVWRWSFNLIFLAFGFLDFLISSVRPGITYWVFALYGIVKGAKLYAAFLAAVHFAELQSGTVGIGEIADAISRTFLNEAAWTTFDQEMMSTVLGFWFGDRTRSKARGNLARV